MRIHAFTLVGACAFLLCLPAPGQTAADDPSIHSSTHPTKTPKDADDTVAILEVGASTSWNFSGGAATFAPNLAAECTPIEDWLELEAGVSPFYTRNSTEWDTDFSSRSRGLFPARPSSCLVWGRNGLISNETAKRRIHSPESWLETSCSGQQEGTALGGTWSRPMITALLVVISSR